MRSIEEKLRDWELLYNTIEKIAVENSSKQQKKQLELGFNPGLASIDLRTTQYYSHCNDKFLPIVYTYVCDGSAVQLYS